MIIKIYEKNVNFYKDSTRVPQKLVTIKEFIVTT